jgi:hypothetical protein
MNRSFPIDLNTTVMQTMDLVASELDGETLVMSLARAAYYGLDATAQHIWNLIAQPCRVSDLCDILVSEYAVEREICEQEVCAFLNELNAEGLIRIISAASD